MVVNYCLNCMESMDPGVYVCPRCGADNRRLEVRYKALRLGTILRGRYLVGQVLGQGGFGITYIGLDLLLQMKVAIKEYFPGSQASRDQTVSNNLRWDDNKAPTTQREGCDGFLREARKMAQLTGIPSVVRVQDMFEENNTAYIVMEFVEGEDLKTFLRREGTLPLERCIQLLKPMMQDLIRIHQHGLIHRDLSPDNIMLRSDGRICLLDLGAAKDLSLKSGQSSLVVAKDGFSPLEQYSAGADIGPWTDVYALCATIYYCVTGRCVPSPLDRMAEDTAFDGVTASAFGSCLPVLQKGLALLAKNRIRDVGQLLQMLESAEGAGGIQGEGNASGPKTSQGTGSAPEVAVIPQTLPYAAEEQPGAIPETAPMPQSGKLHKRRKEASDPADAPKPAADMAAAGKRSAGLEKKIVIWAIVVLELLKGLGWFAVAEIPGIQMLMGLPMSVGGCLLICKWPAKKNRLFLKLGLMVLWMFFAFTSIWWQYDSFFQSLFIQILAVAVMWSISTAKKMRLESEAAGGAPAPLEKTSLKTVILWIGALAGIDLLLYILNLGAGLISFTVDEFHIGHHATIQAVILLIFLPGKRMKTDRLAVLMALCNGLWAFGFYIPSDIQVQRWFPMLLALMILGIVVLLLLQVYFIWKYRKNTSWKWLTFTVVVLSLFVLGLKPWLLIESVWEEQIPYWPYFNFRIYIGRILLQF